MSRGRYTRWIRRCAPPARLAVILLAIAAVGCDPGGDEQPTNDALPAADAAVDLGVDMEPDPKTDAEPPPHDAGPDAAPPMEQGRAPELCVGCGAAASPRFRLIEHGLTPLPDGPARTAASPRFRLILEP